MAQQEPQISEELLAAINADSGEVYQLWKTTCTEEQKAAALRQMEEFQNNPNFKAEKMARQNELFTQADANADGVLDAAEYATYFNSNNADKTAKGEWIDTREDRAATQYALINRINAAQDGVKFADIETMIAVAMPHMQQLRAADGI